MDEPFLDKLSERQKQCLRLVWKRQSSKDIGRLLGLSPHTVDEYLRKAIRLVGAVDRFDAAKRLNKAEKADPQPLIFQSEGVADPSISVTSVPIDEPGSGSRTGQTVAEPRVAFTPPRAAPQGLWVPVPGRGEGERNELSSTERLVWILAMGLAWTTIAGTAALGTAAIQYLIR